MSSAEERAVRIEGSSKNNRATVSKPSIGWREWVILPEFGDARIKAKVDTGARTSAIHAWHVEITQSAGCKFVHFELHPEQRKSSVVTKCTAPLIAIRAVKNSGGQPEMRPIILAHARLGELLWPIEISLTRRDEMGFRMLLGRNAVRGRYLIDPGRSFLQGK